MLNVQTAVNQPLFGSLKGGAKMFQDKRKISYEIKTENGYETVSYECREEYEAKAKFLPEFTKKEESSTQNER